ncbi:hypothetical protein UAJ10_01070 [Nitrospirillum sp. BR 11164]|uniref:hypothetical protein n=1 Tax=Nitrospirillum sp. BR 11164 TaxID=3104324 RepID=UPI002AFEBDF4|nr:hypothetical protein [Nitrospirillum sp. BR 11164]MEA1647607.1 hypothetical protein [Nitrospirillum sp. BR 11164]
MTGEYGRYFGPQRLMGILAARNKAAGFIEHCFGQVDWSRYSVVGFSTSFQQTMASLALARRIKAAHPHILIVFGGANCSDEMGVELHRHYPFIDVVVGGRRRRCCPTWCAATGRGRIWPGCRAPPSEPPTARPSPPPCPPA